MKRKPVAAFYKAGVDTNGTRRYGVFKSSKHPGALLLRSVGYSEETS